MTNSKVTELRPLVTRQDFLNEATRLRTIAVHKHQLAPMSNKGTWDKYSGQSALTKNQIMGSLQSDLQFLDSMCKQAGEGSIFAEEEPIVIQPLATE